MKSAVEEYIARPKRYANIDGTGEMYLGVMMLGFALLVHLQPIVPKSSIFGHGFGAFAFMYVILLPALGLGYWGVKVIKRRITYPRTGYVAYRRDPRARVPALLWAIVLSAGIAAALVLIAGFAQRHEAMDVYRLLNAAICVATYALIPLLFSRQHTWKWLVALFMALGLLAISLSVPGGMREWFRPVSLFLGLTWLASGAITLFLYMRRTHAPKAE